MIRIKTYSINSLPLTNELLVKFLESFWNEIFSSFKDTKHLLILCKVEFSDKILGYRTIGHLRKVNFNDKELYLDYLLQRLSIMNESYYVNPISKITFSYIIRDGLCTDKDRALLSDINDKLPSKHNFNNLNLPISMIPSDYGDVIVDNYVQTKGGSFHRFVVVNGNKTFIIDQTLDGTKNLVKISGNIDLSWTDTKLSELGSDIFMREIKKSN